MLTSIYWKRQLVSNRPSDKPVEQVVVYDTIVYDTVTDTTRDINSPVSLTNNPSYGHVAQ